MQPSSPQLKNKLVTLLLPLIMAVVICAGSAPDIFASIAAHPAPVKKQAFWGSKTSASHIAPNVWGWADPLGLACMMTPPKKPIVIGENMKRVQQYADEIGGQAYRPWKNDPFDYDLGMKRNKRWIKDMKTEGREIIDIGPDFKRRSLGRDPSDFYNMERGQLKDYANYTKVFERFDKTSGGVTGLDFKK
jgi:hypothetical protein